MKPFWLLLVVLCSIRAFGVTIDQKVDSLEHLLSKSTEDTTSFNLHAEIFRLITHNAPKKAESTAFLMLDLANEINQEKYRARAYKSLGVIYNETGRMDSALIFYQNCIKSFTILKDAEGISHAYNNIGTSYLSRGQYDQALEYLLKAAKLSEDRGDTSMICTTYNNIGIIYSNTDEFESALKYQLATLKMKRQTGDTAKIVFQYFNLASIYNGLKQFDKQLKYLTLAMEFDKAAGDFRNYALDLIQLGNYHKNLKNNAASLEAYQQAYKTLNEIGDERYAAIALLNMGPIYGRMGQYEKAAANYRTALEICQRLKFAREEYYCYLGLIETDSLAGNMDQALKNLKTCRFLRDSLTNSARNDHMAELEAQFESGKKEQEVSILNLEKTQLKIDESTNETIFNAVVVGVFLLLFVIGYAVYNYRQKRLLNDALVETNEQILTQKMRLEETNQNIVDSLNYSERIQRTTLPSSEKQERLFPNSFVYYQPKDIISGDFYWMEENEKFRYIAAADCTGHGVPGAFVSMICTNALNQCLKEERLVDPAKILDRTREIVIENFRSKDGNAVRDGMDIALCAFEKGTQNVLYAGANNPLWIVRKQEGSDLTDFNTKLSETHGLREIKADKQPIGEYDKNEPFTTKTVALKQGDAIYLFSDGYVDQFGGAKGKKLKSKRFKQILLQNTELSDEKQREELQITFNSWKADLEQIDDVCVIGIRV